ncbi:unnamed protein product [Amoebophrya sp. A25]|nr:unnamed protein product [Amoebophrya sp. A25]|eukprot:GSA25T00024419001.1
MPQVVVPVYTGKQQVMEDYTFMEKKGEGAFGKVNTVKHKRSGILRACKAIAMPDKEMKELVDTEITLMKSVDHPNILRLYETYYDGDAQVFLVTELCNGGSLFDRLAFHTRQLKKPMSEKQSARYIQETLQALAYCHSMKIVHRDIKPDNVLFVSKSANSTVKVCDLGLSDFMDKIEKAAKTVKINPDKEKINDDLRRTIGFKSDKSNPLIRKVMAKAGTPHYMPAEMHHRAWYDYKADVFACGVMLYQMLTTVHPFFIPGKDNADTARMKIVVGKVDYPSDLWNDVSPLGKQITEQMLACDPDDRLSSFDALKHKWFESALKIENTETLRNSTVENVVSFVKYGKLKQAVLRLLAKEVSEDEIEQLKMQFTLLDKDGDGIVSLEEVLKAAGNAKVNVSKRELEQTLFALHAPGTNVKDTALQIGLNYRDFIGALLEKKVKIDEGHLREIFKRFEDAKQEGFVTTESLKETLKMHRKKGDAVVEEELNANEIAELIGGAQKVDFHRFKTLVYNNIKEDAYMPSVMLQKSEKEKVASEQKVASEISTCLSENYAQS